MWRHRVDHNNTGRRCRNRCGPVPRPPAPRQMFIKSANPAEIHRDPSYRYQTIHIWYSHTRTHLHKPYICRQDFNCIPNRIRIHAMVVASRYYSALYILIRILGVNGCSPVYRRITCSKHDIRLETHTLTNIHTNPKLFTSIYPTFCPTQTNI